MPTRRSSARSAAAERMLRDIIEYAEIEGDPEDFRSPAYQFLDKPHRFIRDLLEENRRLRSNGNTYRR